MTPAEPPEKESRELDDKQSAELEDSIAAQERIVDGLKGQPEKARPARRFLQTLLACRKLRRRNAAS